MANKKEIELLYKITKSSGILPEGEKAKKKIENETDAVNINRKITSKLLAQNFLAFDVIAVGVGAAAIEKTFNIIKNGVDKEKPVDNTGDTEEKKATKTIEEDVNNINTETNNFNANLTSKDYFGGDLKQSYLDTSNENKKAYDKTMQSIDDTNKENKNNISNFIDSIKNNKFTSNVTNNTTTHGVDTTTNAMKKMAETDITKPTVEFSNSVVTAINTTNDAITNKLIPVYNTYGETLINTIANLNEIFNIDLKENVPGADESAIDKIKDVIVNNEESLEHTQIILPQLPIIPGEVTNNIIGGIKRTKLFKKIFSGPPSQTNVTTAGGPN